MAADMQQMARIHDIELEIDDESRSIKVLNEQMNGIVKELPEFAALEDAQKELKMAQERLAQAVTDDRDYSKMLVERNERRIKLKDLREILSHHLVIYFQETGRDVVRDAHGDNRQVDLTAKIGKPALDQEKLPFDAPQFTGDVEVTGPGGEVIHRSPEAQARYERNVARGKELGLSETEVRIATEEPATMEEALQNAQDLIDDRKPRKRPRQTEDLEDRKWPAKNKRQRSREAR